MARRFDLDGVPGVAGVLTPAQCRQTAESIAALQLPSGEIPWSQTGHTDVWDHVECAMALSVGGLTESARAAYDWCRREQRADGSWPIQYRRGVIEDHNSDSNFCAYIATGVWHHVLVTGDRRFGELMWPTVRAAAIGSPKPVSISMIVGKSVTRAICCPRSANSVIVETPISGRQRSADMTAPEM